MYKYSKIMEQDKRLQLWLSQIPRYVKMQRIVKSYTACTCFIFIAILVNKIYGFINSDIDKTSIIVYLNLIICGAIFSYIYIYLSRGCKILKANNYVEDTHMVSYLCEAFALHNFTQGRIAGNPLADAVCFALLKSLPHMQTSDWDELTPHQRSCLHNILYIGNKTQVEQLYGTRLIHAVLSTLERVGDDETSLNHVRNVAEQTENPYLRQLALNCAASIQTRVQRNEASQSLLRPSKVDVSPNMLLRPASGTKQPSSTATKQLLRSSTGGASCASNRHDAFLPDFELPAPQEPLQQVQIGQQAEEDTP